MNMKQNWSRWGATVGSDFRRSVHSQFSKQALMGGMTVFPLVCDSIEKIMGHIPEKEGNERTRIV